MQPTVMPRMIASNAIDTKQRSRTLRVCLFTTEEYGCMKFLLDQQTCSYVSELGVCQFDSYTDPTAPSRIFGTHSDIRSCDTGSQNKIHLLYFLSLEPCPFL